MKQIMRINQVMDKKKIKIKIKRKKIYQVKKNENILLKEEIKQQNDELEELNEKIGEQNKKINQKINELAYFQKINEELKKKN